MSNQLPLPLPNRCLEKNSFYKGRQLLAQVEKRLPSHVHLMQPVNKSIQLKLALNIPLLQMHLSTLEILLLKLLFKQVYVKHISLGIRSQTQF